MRNDPRRLLPLFATALLTAGLTGNAFAAQAKATATKTAPARTAQANTAQARPAQGNAAQPGNRAAPRPAPQITYYRGDPLSGGTRLGTAAGTRQPGSAPFADAPQGATHALITTPSGRRIVDLRDAAQNAGRRGAGDPGGRGDGANRDGDRQDGARPGDARPGAGGGPGRR